MPQKNHLPQTKKRIAVTPAKLAANRANAQKSTGPRTPEGKEASRFNALTHGATARQLRDTMDRLGEDPAEYDRFRQGFLDSLPPATFLESYLIENLADTAWRLDRLARCQNAMQVVDVGGRAERLSSEGETINDIQRDELLGPDDRWKQTIRLEGQLSRHFERQFNLLAKLRKMRRSEAAEEGSQVRGPESGDGGRPVIVPAPQPFSSPQPRSAPSGGPDTTGLDYVRIEPKLEAGSNPEPPTPGSEPKENLPEQTQTLTEAIEKKGGRLSEGTSVTVWSPQRQEGGLGAWDLDKALAPGINHTRMWKVL